MHLRLDPSVAAPQGRGALQVAVKVQGLAAPVVYFEVPFSAEGILVPGGGVGAQEFIQKWPTLHGEPHRAVPAGVTSAAAVAARLEGVGFRVVHQRPGAAGETCVFASGTVLSGAPVLMDVRVREGQGTVQVQVKSPSPEACPGVLQALTAALA